MKFKKNIYICFVQKSPFQGGKGGLRVTHRGVVANSGVYYRVSADLTRRDIGEMQIGGQSPNWSLEAHFNRQWIRKESILLVM